MSDPTPTPTYFLPAPPDRGDDTLSSFLLAIVLTAIESGYGSYWSTFRRARVDGSIEPDDTMALIQAAIDEDGEDGDSTADDDDSTADDGVDLLDFGDEPAIPAYLPFPSDEDPAGWAFVAYMAPDGEPSDDCPPTVVTEATMRAAFDRIALTPPDKLALHRRYVRDALGSYFLLDAGDVMDAELADYVLQIACYGEVLCS